MQQDLSISFLIYNNSSILYDNLWNLVESLPPGYSSCLYVIDNNSSDESWEEVLRFEQDFVQHSNEFEHVRLVLIANPKNVGFGRGHNTLLQQIESQYHLVMNPDIHIDSQEQLKAMIGYFGEHQEVGLLVPQLKNSDGSIQYLCKKNPTLLDLIIRRLPLAILKARQDAYTMMQTGYEHIMTVEYASGCFMLFRSEIFRKLGGFDERFFMYLEDADISRRVNQISKVVYFPRAKVIHDWYRGTYRSPRLFLINLHSMIIYFRKWGWRIW